MKQANNNEVDLLLQSIARGREESAARSALSSGDGKQFVSEHLDADELNSYAEGVAPAYARARYMEHLADCDSCRKIVVGLNQTAGAANRYEVPAESGFALWQKLAALFSPPVLRYAVPALVLSAVIGIGFLALKQRPDTQFVAQNEQRTKAPSLTPGENDAAANNAPAPQSTIQDTAQPETKRHAVIEKENPSVQKERVAESSPAPQTLSQLAPGKDAGLSADSATTAGSRGYAPEPKAAAPPPPAAVFDSAKSTDLAKERPVKREDQPRAQDEVSRAEGDDLHGPNRSKSNTGSPADGRTAGIMRVRGPSAADKKKTGEASTRTVMGRHFAREGNAWIDTAYEPSRATVRVTRGSDQFRALVADEPGIRSIAEQLDGVVVVVWKGRAYRIQ
ncbi:MAG: zf-HC2 domain-containing protein [Acidobacteriota bacterium]